MKGGLQIQMGSIQKLNNFKYFPSQTKWSLLLTSLCIYMNCHEKMLNIIQVKHLLLTKPRAGVVRFVTVTNCAYIENDCKKWRVLKLGQILNGFGLFLYVPPHITM